MLENASPLFHDNRISFPENVTYNFFDLDTESTFFANRKRLGEAWKYYDSMDKLVYNYDEFGFRNNHSLNVIQNSQYIVTIGCSHTMGTGLYHEETYSYKLEKISGFPVYNMGLSGSSNEVSVFNLIWLLSNFNPPNTIVFQTAAEHRFPLLADTNVTFNGPWITRTTDEKRKILEFMLLSADIGYNTTKYSMLKIMLEQITKKLNTKLFFVPNNICPVHVNDELARDLLHYGSEFNERLAKNIWSKISAY